MSVQRIERAGKVRYRARIKWHGREIATQVFDRKRDADAWEDDQLRKLQAGTWIDPRRGRITLNELHQGWEESRRHLKRQTRESDESAWQSRVQPAFGKYPVQSLTEGDVKRWVGGMVESGLAYATARRYLGTLRSLLKFAVSDARVHVNVAAGIKLDAKGQAVQREGQFLSYDELFELRSACNGQYAELILVLGLAGLRWGELAGIQVGDLVQVPGKGIRLRRAVLASRKTGELYVETLKGKHARTVPLTEDLHEIVERWSSEKEQDQWLFHAPMGGPLSESNWKRSIKWSDSLKTIGRQRFRVHDLRHTAASVWLAAGADPKVVQRILGHSSAAMTMDLYGHLIDNNLWEAAKRIGGTTGAQTPKSARNPKSRNVKKSD